MEGAGQAMTGEKGEIRWGRERWAGGRGLREAWDIGRRGRGGNSQLSGRRVRVRVQGQASGLTWMTSCILRDQNWRAETDTSVSCPANLEG